MLNNRHCLSQLGRLRYIEHLTGFTNALNHAEFVAFILRSYCQAVDMYLTGYCLFNIYDHVSSQVVRHITLTSVRLKTLWLCTISWESLIYDGYRLFICSQLFHNVNRQNNICCVNVVRVTILFWCCIEYCCCVLLCKYVYVHRQFLDVNHSLLRHVLAVSLIYVGICLSYGRCWVCLFLCIYCVVCKFGCQKQRNRLHLRSDYIPAVLQPSTIIP